MKTEIPLQNRADKRQPIELVGLDSLSSVIEQDGIVLSTPSGIRRRAKRVSNRDSKSNTIFNVQRVLSNSNMDEQVERMDAEVVACLVRRHEKPQAKSIKVKHTEHEQSPFVVSLRDCYVLPEVHDAERVSLAVQAELCAKMPVADKARFSREILKSSALHSKADPWMILKHFTPEEAYKQKKRLGIKKSVKVFLRSIVDLSKLFIASLKKKEAKLEERVGKEMEEIITQARVKRVSFVKTLVGFFVIAAAMTLPAQALVLYKSITHQKSVVEAQSMDAANALAAASGSLNFSDTTKKLQDASGKFHEASRLLDESRLMAVGAAALVPAKYRSARALLEVGDKMAQSGQLLTLGLSKIFNDTDRGLIERIEVMGAYARGALPLLSDAEAAADSVDLNTVPEANRGEIQSLPEQIKQAKEAVREFAVLADALTVFLGKDGLRNYLLVFQNNSELRPSGGFMGSVAEVRFDNGKILSVYVPGGGTYDLKGQLVTRVQSPLPLHLINPLWQFQDANWYADFARSAEMIRWFWSKSGQPTLDGVVAINATFMERLLAVTGPIDMPEYGKVITAENFLVETQMAVEMEYDKTENKPKKFIGDLFTKLMEKIKILSKDEWIALAAETSKGLDTKEIQVAMFDPKDEELVERFEWNSRLKDTDGDSLAIIGANIAGQKTDAVVDESVTHRANIKADGSIVDTLTIKRIHKGKKGDLFYGVRNVQYLRVYVPKGAKLIKATGFDPPKPSLFKKPLETDAKDPDLEAVELSAKPGVGNVWTATEGSRTVFGGWLQLDPGHEQEIILVYELPFNITDIMSSLNESTEAIDTQNARGAYTILLTSQSGKPRMMDHKIYAEAPWNIVWARPDLGMVSEGKPIAGLDGLWERDRVVAALVSLKENLSDDKAPR